MILYCQYCNEPVERARECIPTCFKCKEKMRKEYWHKNKHNYKYTYKPVREPRVCVVCKKNYMGKGNYCSDICRDCIGYDKGKCEKCGQTGEIWRKIISRRNYQWLCKKCYE